jgi:hypothetical protein
MDADPTALTHRIVDGVALTESKRLDREVWLRRGIPSVRHEIDTACAAAADADSRAPIVIGHSREGLPPWPTSHQPPVI